MLGFPIRDASHEILVGMFGEENLQPNEMISAFILRRHPFASEPQDCAGIGAFRNCKIDDARHGVDPHLGPCQRLAGRHRQRRADVAALAAKDRMRPDMNFDQRVARIGTAEA